MMKGKASYLYRLTIESDRCVEALCLILDNVSDAVDRVPSALEKMLPNIHDAMKNKVPPFLSDGAADLSNSIVRVLCVSALKIEGHHIRADLGINDANFPGNGKYLFFYRCLLTYCDDNIMFMFSPPTAMKNIEAGFFDLIVESDSSDEESGKKPASLPRAEDITPIKDTCKALTARGIGARNLATKLSKNSLTELAGHHPETRGFKYTMRYDEHRHIVVRWIAEQKAKMKGDSQAKADDVENNEEEQVDGYALDVAKPLHIRKQEAQMRDMVSELLGEFHHNPEDYESYTSLVLVGSNNEDNFDSAMKTNDPRCHLDLNVSLELFRRIPAVITKIETRSPDHLELATRSSDIASTYSSYFIIGLRVYDPLTGTYIDVDNRSTEQKVAKIFHRASTLIPALIPPKLMMLIRRSLPPRRKKGRLLSTPIATTILMR
jgi:phage terminase Nu1 subunit (DNA packaging protein)